MTESTLSVLDSASATKIIQAAPSPIIAASATMSLPTTATTYAIGDVIANSTTAGSVVPFSWTVGKLASGYFALDQLMIELATTDTNWSAMPVVMKIYDSAPTLTVGDDGVWALNTTVSGYRGDIAVTLNQNFGAGTQTTLGGVGVPTQADRIWIQSDVSSKIYGILVAGAAIVRTVTIAHTFTARVAGLQY